MLIKFLRYVTRRVNVILIDMYNVYQIDTCNREDNMSQSHVEHESSDIACNFG